MGLVYRRNRITSLAGILGTLLTLFAAIFTVTPIHAETGKGEDIFKVIMTIFGVDKSKGDVVAIVTANNGEASRVKFLDTGPPPKLPNPTALTPITSPGTNGGIIEYVATFPNVTVNVGTEYKACVITTKSMDLACTTGNNSPAARPEFVDISLNISRGAGESTILEGSETEGE
jgi:hypothetical protein